MGKWSDALLSVNDAPAGQAAGSGKYSRALLGTPAEDTQTAPQAQSQGWGDWLSEKVNGRQDPAEANTGTVYEQFKPELTSPTATAALMGADDAAMADVIQKNLGGKFIRREKDVNGNPIMITRGPNGQEQRGYVNRPGLDTQDAWRFVYGAIPYGLAGGAAGAAVKGAGIGVQALAQGAAAGTTSLAGDVGSMALGSEQGIDTGKAAVMAGFGAGGQVAGAAASALWRKFVTIPGLIDTQTGQLTERGLAAAQKAGLNPDELAPDFSQAFAKALAETRDPAKAATRAGVESPEFRIPATRGQVTKDPYLLTQEEGFRRRLGGEAAQDTMLAFDRKQADAVRWAALDSVGGRFAPDRFAGAMPTDRMPITLGSSVQQALGEAKSGAKSALSEAWKGTQDLGATPEALANLPGVITSGLKGETRFTPTAEKMAALIGDFAQGKAPAKEIGGITLDPVKSVDQMRRSLLGLVKSAADPEDARQAGIVYDAYNSWLGDSAKSALLSGDPEGAMRIVSARGFTKEVKDLFEPKSASGTTLPAARRITKALEQADSGEGVINALLGSQGSRGVADGTAQALQNVQTVLHRFAPQSAEAAWNDIRLAYWTRLVTGKTGEMLGPQAMVSNIKNALHSQRSVVNVLYSKADVAMISRFTRAVERIAYKPPNASGSGYTAASFIKDGLMKVLSSFGLDKPAVAVLNYSGVGNAWNSAIARRAVSQVAPPIAPNVSAASAMAGEAYRNSQSGGR